MGNKFALLRVLSSVGALMVAAVGAMGQAAPVCPCDHLPSHIQTIEVDAGFNCHWIVASSAYIPTEVIGPPVTTKVILDTQICCAHCKIIECPETFDAARWEYDMVAHSIVYGSVTQPNACFTVGEVVGFANAVAQKIDSSAAVRDVAGVFLYRGKAVPAQRWLNTHALSVMIGMTHFIR